MRFSIFFLHIFCAAQRYSLKTFRQHCHFGQVHFSLFEVLFANRTDLKSDIMAAKRLTTSSINFVEVAAKIPESQRASFNAIKTSTEGLVRRIAALPADKPKLNWDLYRSKIAVAGKVWSK